MITSQQNYGKIVQRKVGEEMKRIREVRYLRPSRNYMAGLYYKLYIYGLTDQYMTVFMPKEKTILTKHLSQITGMTIGCGVMYNYKQTLYGVY